MTLRMAEEVTILREIVPLPPYNLFRQAVLLSAGLEAGHGPGQSLSLIHISEPTRPY